MVSVYTTNKGIEVPASGDYVNTWATPVNADWNTIDKAFGGTTNINVTAVSGIVALTLTQYQALILNITGTLTANVTYQVPSTVGGQWIVKNGTTGAYTLTISSGGAGTSLVVPQGYSTVVVSDGTNITRADTTPVTAAGSNTQIQYNASGVLGASSNLTFDGTTLALTGAQTISTTLGVTGAVTLSSTLGVTGAITGSSTITGTALIPSGSSVPTNGVYLPAANTVGVATNTTERLRINSTGAWGIAGANYGTSGQVLTSAGSSSAPTWSDVSAAVGTVTTTTLAASIPIGSGVNLLVKAGRATISGGSATITFSSAFPTACIGVYNASTRGGSGEDAVNLTGNPTTTGFSVGSNDSTNNQTYFWLAVGY
jgi:hypothetical protein